MLCKYLFVYVRYGWLISLVIKLFTKYLFTQNNTMELRHRLVATWIVDIDLLYTGLAITHQKCILKLRH